MHQFQRTVGAISLGDNFPLRNYPTIVMMLSPTFSGGVVSRRSSASLSLSRTHDSLTRRTSVLRIISIAPRYYPVALRNSRNGRANPLDRMLNHSAFPRWQEVNRASRARSNCRLRRSREFAGTGNCKAARKRSLWVSFQRVNPSEPICCDTDRENASQRRQAIHAHETFHQWPRLVTSRKI